MLGWATAFLVVLVIAAVFAFGGPAASAGAAQMLFFLFLGLFVLSLLVSLIRTRRMI